MQRIVVVLVALLAVLCCGYAAVATAREMAWVRALDAALASARSDGELARTCSREDETLRARARQHPTHEGEVLISDHGAPALFVGDERSMVCLSCVRAVVCGGSGAS